MAQSALNLRLVLAVLGATLSFLLAVLVLRAFGFLLALPLFVLAAVGFVDAVVVQIRRQRRARAHRYADHRHDSLFE